MRLPRLAILVFFASAFLILFSRALTAPASRATPSRTAPERQPGRSILGLFYYNTPFSLFPPNAAISLTDDNSTSFAARPAAFGPKLVSKGLSGQLWVGSGFSDDSLEGIGELGCSDIPGWDDGNTRSVLRPSALPGTLRNDDPRSRPSFANKQGDLLLDARQLVRKEASDLDDAIIVNDGTDDHLHKRLLPRDASNSPHADIQSIQEGAEIKGKIALLMRGGCGFLEKIMWAQRRGAIAVIVGDNQRGGPLIQMFAHGDEVDNVTIPSVFTARTSAQLLSALSQPGSFDDDAPNDNEVPPSKAHRGVKTIKNKKTQKTTSTLFDRSSRPGAQGSPSSTSWLSRIFSRGKPSQVDGISHPPSGGKPGSTSIGFEKDTVSKIGMAKTKQLKQSSANEADMNLGHPDKMAGGRKVAETKISKEDFSSKQPPSPENDGPQGGIITPGSGEYKPRVLKDGKDTAQVKKGVFSKLFGENDMEISAAKNRYSTGEDDETDPPKDGEPLNPPHDGLWVTITPTSSASPFFDTLLVLIISPLVTLTIVYALLILRARIRRRRWRAPKSVVERLPVRTYHTVARSPSLSPRLPSPTSASPTTPLLQQSPSRSRPRSRTTTGFPEREGLLVPSSAPGSSSRSGPSGRHPGQEKGAAGFSAEWKKYMGRQVECVVCLEEYIDGVSRVMRLPCGHEFHADCITPWLTTRRRTCPICKGDVVRSMTQGSWSIPRYEPYRDDDEEEEGESSGSQSSSGSGSGSGSGNGGTTSDPEQGLPEAGPSESRRQAWQTGWLGIFSNNFGGARIARPRSPSADNRNR